MSKVQLSAVIITYNEESNIDRCLSSLKGVADEIVVVDSFSTDGTESICNEHNVRFIQNKFEGHIEQKNFAISQASFDHVLSLDADEALTTELVASIQKVKNEFTADAYSFNRLTNYCGKWIRHCGWYPDRKLRIWDRRKGKWGGTNPHDKVIMKDGVQATHLKGDLLHYSFYSVRQHIDQINYFTDISSKAAFEKGKKSNWAIIFSKTCFKFFRDYILKLGILDGYYGLVICLNSAFAKYLKYVKLRALNKQ